eukprot:TRINITY_DN467_c0_g1_i1.p2 TRINITY_DN467_c0_g1~~TRINITY_DN467_c0_g1_i1.p2  ORF type:complete len:124 (-),score=38.29 TRINITY_DN467_c0_g1_i1:280-651(-)
MSEQTLFDRLGGDSALETAVENFYQKVMSDSTLSPFFKNTNMERQKKMQKQFLTYAFGGSKQWNGKTMRAVHTRSVKEGLNDTHFDSVVNHLATTLKEMGAKEEDIKEVARISETIRNDVLNK